MRRILLLAGVIVLGLSAAASGDMITRDQLMQMFSGSDSFSNGFRAGYAAGVADTARTAFQAPAMITLGVNQCTQRLTPADLQRFAGMALQQWQNRYDPSVTAAAELLRALNTCSTGGEPREPNQQR
jgi:hypothetical protein